MVLLAVVVCLRLGWWQWHRTHEASGTVQNLGYAILWPVFGGAFIYMWVRFLQLELLKDAEDDAELTEFAAGDPLPAAGSTDPIATDLDPEHPDADHGPAELEPPGDSAGTDLCTPSRGITVAVSTVGDDTDEEDPELAAYNRALAALAEKDHRRAR